MTRILDIAVGALILATWAGWAIMFAHGTWKPDLSALYLAGYFYGLEDYASVYAAPLEILDGPTPESWAAALRSFGEPEAFTLPFLYPPIWAALLAPIASATDPQGFFNAISATQIVLLALSVFLAWRIAGQPGRFTVWAGIVALILWLSAPGLLAIMHAQPQITVTFLIVLAVERWRAGHPVAAGLALGLAAALKITPVLFVLLFLAARDWRATATALLTPALIALASIALTGWALHEDFLARGAALSDSLVRAKVNWSLHPILTELAALASGTPLAPIGRAGVDVFPAPGWTGPIALAIAALGILALLRATRTTEDPDRTALRLMGLGLIVGLTGPLGWSHYFLLPLLFTPVLLTRLPLVPTAAALTAVLAVASFPAFPLLDRLSGALTLTAALPAAAMIALFALACAAARPRA